MNTCDVSSGEPESRYQYLGDNRNKKLLIAFSV